jgi:predicted alpha/beta-fold hydrolase
MQITLPEGKFMNYIEDIQMMVDYIKQLDVYKDHVFYAVGHSFGANNLIKYTVLHKAS